MGIEYKIRFSVPATYSDANVRKKLPPSFDEKVKAESYSYALEPDGFYFLDTLANINTSSLAFRRLVDEALLHSESVEVIEL